MNNKIFGMALVAGSMALSTGAQAAIISDSFSIEHSITDLTTATATGTLNQFDTNLGTLNSISLTMSGESNSTTVLTNTSAQAQRFSFESILDWDFEVLANSGTFLDGFETTLATTNGTVVVPPPPPPKNILDLGTTIQNGSITYTFTGAEMDEFLGTGTVGIGCNTLTGSAFVGGGGNINNEQSTTASCDGMIEYNFSGASVPEPATLALIGLGFAGLGFRRQAKKV